MDDYNLRLGCGKTCTAILIAEKFVKQFKNHNKKIIIIGFENNTIIEDQILIKIPKNNLLRLD